MGGVAAKRVACGVVFFWAFNSAGPLRAQLGVGTLAAGKPTGETMAIKRLDDHHAFAVLKMDGKPFGTSKSTLSADGKTLTVENEISLALAGQTAGKQTEIWLRK